MSQEKKVTPKLEELLDKYIFQEKYVKGYSFNPYGNVSAIEESLKGYLDKKFPIDPVLGKRNEVCGNQILCEIYIQEEWAAISDVFQRFWAVWRPMLQKLSVLVLDRMKAEEMPAELVDSMKSVSDFFAVEDLSYIAADHVSAISKWKDLQTELKGLGMQVLIIIHDFDKVAGIFPEAEAEGGMFFRELFRLTIKSHKGNREKIVLISEKKCSLYEHHNPGSSLSAAYPLVHVKEEE